MHKSTLQLFDEFVVSFGRGRDPDVREFLRRAGADAAALAQLIDTFLAGSDPPPTDPERVELMRSWVAGEPPLLKLRKERALRRAEVVSRLTKLLGLAPEREPKVARYYHKVEGGLLDSRRIDARVWQALEQVFGKDVRDLADWRWVAPTRQLAYRVAEVPAPGDYVPAELAEEEDDVDRLFLSGS